MMEYIIVHKVRVIGTCKYKKCKRRVSSFINKIGILWTITNKAGLLNL